MLKDQNISVSINMSSTVYFELCAESEYAQVTYFKLITHGNDYV